MKHLRLSTAMGLAVVLGLGWFALSPQRARANFQGVGTGSYLTNITDASTGAFSSRSVITLHSDHTLTAIDSGQEASSPTFSSQQGTWTQQGYNGSVKASTLDFSFQSPQTIARVDYVINAASGEGNISGTLTLTIFPINGNPFGGGGTVVGNFNFTGQSVPVE